MRPTLCAMDLSFLWQGTAGSRSGDHAVGAEGERGERQDPV